MAALLTLRFWMTTIGLSPIDVGSMEDIDVNYNYSNLEDVNYSYNLQTIDM